MPPIDAPPNALRPTGTTYQQLNNGNGDGNNQGSPPVWNVSPVSRGGVGPSLGTNQQPYGLQPNNASNQPFWANQSGTSNSTPKYQYTPPEQPRVFGQRVRKLFGGSPATTQPTNTPASLPPATAMSPSASMNATPNTAPSIGLPSAKPARPATASVTMMSGTAPAMSGTAPAAILAAPRIMQAGARPDWGWHGYDNFNQLGPIGNQQTIIRADSRSSSAISNPDMGPYLKYAHLWRPSNGSAAITNPALTQRPTASPVVDEGFSVPKEPSPAGNATGDHGAIHSLPPSIQDGPILNPESEPAHLQPANYGSAGAEAPHRKVESSQPMDSLTVWPVTNRAAEAQPNARAPISPPPAPTGSGLPLPVREKIGDVCKDKARNLIVEQISPLHLRVGFMCKTQAEADAITNHLAGVRELAPYNLDYEIQIGQ
jgi:hypothetical protein